MMQRVMRPLMSLKRIMAFNDEGHHCYRERPGGSKKGNLDPDEKAEADRNNATARFRLLLAEINVAHRTVKDGSRSC